MPRYRNRSKPASGEESGAALDAPSASPAPSNPGFGPQSRAANDAALGGGLGGHRSSQSNLVPEERYMGEREDGGQ